ncbi:MAG TPA: hypothetical protein DDY11_04315 [Leclercia adecarboxylata]|nr:hypothetical protein [Leclercia adecarboxylata]
MLKRLICIARKLCCGAVSEAEQQEYIKQQLRKTSESFRKKTGRHIIKSKEKIYCAFALPKLVVSREEAQRDASMRLARFGIRPEDVTGKRILDLGCNNGAMLFQLSNYSPSYCLGVEYDSEKVQIANKIIDFNSLKAFDVREGDVDKLTVGELGGQFDIVLCLAIEAHVTDPDRLYRLLGDVTADVLYFEGNGGAKVDSVKAQLEAVGFHRIEYIGCCDDDIVESNNKRPLFVARKGN